MEGQLRAAIAQELVTWEILLTPAGDQVSYVGLALILFN